MKIILSAFTSGLIFAIGLGLAGMTRPTKVLGFLNLAGRWDPSLMLVMVGAISVFAITYRFMMRRKESLLGSPLHVPPRGSIDWKLLLGAAIFGVGWGLGGFCPGPAIVGAAGQAPDALLFVVAMIVGQFAHAWLTTRGSKASENTRKKGTLHHANQSIL